MVNSFQSKSTLSINNSTFQFYSLPSLKSKGYSIDTLPYSLKILLENLLRFEDGQIVQAKDIETLAKWSPKSVATHEIAFTPSRVILQDFTGVPAIVDLAAMRDAMEILGGNPRHINPLNPVELVIDHSVMVDYFGKPDALKKNTELEFKRNNERYGFLRWGQTAFQNFRVVPPGTGIVHQVNLEYLARVIFSETKGNETLLYPDTLVGTDSHTTMINGLGVLGWGVGGIEAEAAMLGQPVTMLIPEVVGVKLIGTLPTGTTATDLVLTITERLRKKGVVGKFVEFFGKGLQNLTLADRATIANMAPEYGATCSIFPIDDETLRYLELTGRSIDQIQIIEAYAKAQEMFHTENSPEANYNDILEVDLSQIEPSLAGPKRPQDRVPLKTAKSSFQTMLNTQLNTDTYSKPTPPTTLTHGSVVIAAITSCTNTSNPEVMIAAGLLAKKAKALGLQSKPWVKTSLAPGSQVVTDYLEKANLLQELAAIGFNLVGYGCTTCIGNSGPLSTEVSQTIKQDKLSVCAVLSGNRNFEGRIHPEVQNAYLASPPLVVAYALSGTLQIDFYKDALGSDQSGKPIYLKDIWPSNEEIQNAIKESLHNDLYKKRYAKVFEGDQQWQALSLTEEERFEWKPASSYIQHPPYFENMPKTPASIQDIKNARVLALFGDSVTTDHISPAGSIAPTSPAGQYLISLGVDPKDFNSYGARRGNHEVMVRGTFANIRLKNLLIPGSEGNVTLHHPTQEKMSIYDASMLYQKDNCPLIVIAGKEYGTGSSRDWAAKGPRLLGIRAVIAESFERIHRSNLIGMGILPLEFMPGENKDTLQLMGSESYSIALNQLQAGGTVTVQVNTVGETMEFKAKVRIDTPKELEYYQHGGILHYVLRQLMKAA